MKSWKGGSLILSATRLQKMTVAHAEEKSQKAIQDEIRQITATVTFLPLLKVSCSCRCCDTEEDAQVANQWKSSSVEVDTHSEGPTSSEGATCTVLIHGPIELKKGWWRQKRQLFLYSDSLLMSNTKYNKNFKIKKKIPLNTMWIANCMDIVGDASIRSGRSFVLGWPTVNFVATFRALRKTTSCGRVLARKNFH